MPFLPPNQQHQSTEGTVSNRSSIKRAKVITIQLMPHKGTLLFFMPKILMQCGVESPPTGAPNKGAVGNIGFFSTSRATKTTGGLTAKKLCPSTGSVAHYTLMFNHSVVNKIWPSMFTDRSNAVGNAIASVCLHIRLFPLYLWNQLAIELEILRVGHDHSSQGLKVKVIG